jgi:phospholipid/cholesterol/gamma-HCH transport system substrate-binding protein
MQVFRSEIKVGLLILVSFAVFMASIFIVSDIRNLWDEKKELTLLFPYADGITVGAPVWYAGLQVGTVSNVRIAGGDTDAIAISVKISPEARVRRDSRVDIRNLGMMGAKYVEISPGTPDSPLLASGETLEGKSPASMSEIIETGREVASHLLQVAKETQLLIHEVRAEAPIRDTVQNANEFITELRDRAREIQPVLARLSSLADSLDKAGKNVSKVSGDGGKELTALLKELRETNKGLQTRLQVVEAQLTQTLGAVSKGVSSAEATVTDLRSIVSSSEKDIEAIFRHMNETSQNLEALSSDLRDHPWKVIWKKDGRPSTIPAGTQEWRDKGRIGPHGKE